MSDLSESCMSAVSESPASGLHTVLLLLLMLLVTLVFIPAVGSVDMSIWLFWGENALYHGLVEGYVLNGHEHPPGLTMLLWAAQHLALVSGIKPAFAIKLTFLPFLFASSAIVYVWSGRYLPATLIFHIVLVYSAMALGYIDVYFAPFILWSFYALHQGKLHQAMLAFTSACLIKYPPLMILPFFLLYVWRFTEGAKKRILLFLSVLIVPFLLLLINLAVFGLEPLFALQRAFHHSILSAQALNLNWVITRLLLADGVFPMTAHGDNATLLIAKEQIPAVVIWLSRFLFGFFYAAAALFFLVRKQSVSHLLLCCFLAHYAYFMFSIGVHENHLFLSTLLLLMLYCINTGWWVMAVIICTVSSLNLLSFYGLDGHPLSFLAGVDYEPFSLHLAGSPYPVDVRLILAIFNFACFLVVWASVLFPRDIPLPRTLNVDN